LNDADLGAPAPRPAQVFGIGLNYRAHAAEAGLQVPDRPAVFTKFPTCITGPFSDVELPSAMTDWEVELVVVIGVPRTPRERRRCLEPRRRAHGRAGRLGARRAVGGGGQFSLGKSFPDVRPMGPCLVTPTSSATATIWRSRAASATR
jgi:2-keto-4-pentenoate hydratase/2-oxohepta-3-ene-1,7-dioic acid hydratase in catechol pathway